MFVPRRDLDTECGDVLRETAIPPAQWKAKIAAGEWFGAKPKVFCAAARGICGLQKNIAKPAPIAADF